jgi:hypothetical protein
MVEACRVCCGGGNLNLEEKGIENETWIKVIGWALVSIWITKF